MELVLDSGNSSTKIFVFEGTQIIHRAIEQTISIDELSGLFVAFPAIKYAIWSSVTGYNSLIEDFLYKHCAAYWRLNEKLPIPIVNLYENPQKLGKDRIAAAVGAWKRSPNTNLLVVDAGTALTIDLVSAEGAFMGGNISPGMSMRFRALHEFTRQLPLISPQESYPAIGRNTQDAIAAGVQQGMLFELESYINKLRTNYSSLTVMLTGGDGFFFAKKLKSTIFAPYLVAEGLREILLFNLAKA